MVESDFESGAEFPKGETTVHITATDKAGNLANYSFTVTIVDQQAPSINCQADINVNNEPNQCGKVVNYGLPTVSNTLPCGLNFTTTLPLLSSPGNFLR